MACDLNLSEDERQILEAAASMLEAHFPVSRKRGGGRDRLSELAGFGLFGLALRDDGGAAYGGVEEALLYVLLGRHAVSTGALAASLAVRLAAAAGRRDLAEAVAVGEASVCAALSSDASLLLVERCGASLALIFGDRELTLAELDDVETVDVAALGHGEPLQRVTGGHPVVVARSSDEALLAATDLLISAQLLGGAEAARDLAVEYAKVRQQFGQPIGGFQAIKHHCADMAVAAEMASAQLDMAALALRDRPGEAAFQIAALRRLAERAAFSNARTAVQVHGGMGFSAEADVHHYLKQAHLLSRLGKGADMLAMPAPLSPHAVLPGGI